MTDPTPLAKCPFCGGEARLTNVEMVGCAYVACQTCGAQGDDASAERAVEKWNTRAPVAVMTDIEQLMLKSMATSLRAGLPFSFSREDMAGLLDRLSALTTRPARTYEQGWNEAIKAAANECLRRCDDNPHDFHWRRHSLPRAIRALTPAAQEGE